MLAENSIQKAERMLREGKLVSEINSVVGFPRAVPNVLAKLRLHATGNDKAVSMMDLLTRCIEGEAAVVARGDREALAEHISLRAAHLNGYDRALDGKD
jgi:hypothetical protein